MLRPPLRGGEQAKHKTDYPRKTDMSRNKQSRKVWAGALVTVVALAGSAQAVVYSFEDFGGGTPNYTINGVNNGTTSDSWQKLQSGGVDIQPADALVGTDYA